MALVWLPRGVAGIVYPTCDTCLRATQHEILNVLYGVHLYIVIHKHAPRTQGSRCGGYHFVLVNTKNSCFDAARGSNCNIFFGFSCSTRPPDFILHREEPQTRQYQSVSFAEHGSYYTHSAETGRHSSFCTASWPTRESEACCRLLV